MYPGRVLSIIWITQISMRGDSPLVKYFYIKIVKKPMCLQDAGAWALY